jgi:flagellar biosynthesis/type III secretory pathway chaperone
MNSSLPEKEKLLSMLTEIHDQLEELETVLEASFSDLRNQMNNEELNKLSAPVQRLSKLEEELDKINTTTSDAITEQNISVAKALKLEMGFWLPIEYE